MAADRVDDLVTKLQSYVGLGGKHGFGQKLAARRALKRHGLRAEA